MSAPLHVVSSASSHTMADDNDSHPSASASAPAHPTHFHLVFSQSLVTPAVLAHRYPGAGTDDDPYVVEFVMGDPRNPKNFSMTKKWLLTIAVAVATLAVTFASSAYTGGIVQVVDEFGCSVEVATLGLALFVLGFAIGPLFWGPMSELYGRQVMFITTYAALTAFNAGAAGSQNIATLLILRFFAGAFGSSPLTNAGGVIADMFAASHRGLALSVFAVAPFLGPTIGPIVGGFVAQTIGWRWNEGIMAIFTGVLCITGALLIPETYPPLLLRKRAAKLSRLTRKVYRSQVEIAKGAPPKPALVFKQALLRPWVLLLWEPIVLLLSIYMAIVYGTLYLCFSAFPIVYQEDRGWSQGVGGLAFIGVAIGMMAAIAYTFPENKRYQRAEATAKARGEFGASPETRLLPAMVGSVFLPIGLFWFAWTNFPQIHWSVSIIATIPFGFGMVLVFLSIFNYLIDAYTIYAASVLAANSVMRSLFGAVFPLFTNQMYQNLGIHWASSIPAFLALACVPFPFLFFKYGPAIRQRCKFSAQAAREMEIILREQAAGNQEKKRGEPAENGLARENAERPSNVDMTGEGSDVLCTENEESQDAEKDLEKGVV